MGIGSFFRIPAHNVFDYKPRFYDPEKEKRKEKLRLIRDEQGKHDNLESVDNVVPGSRIKGSFRSGMSRRKYSRRSSVVRFLVILGFLFFIAYLIIVVDLSPIINYFSK